MQLSSDTVYLLASLGDPQATAVRHALAYPEHVAYVRNGRMGVERKPSVAVHASVALASKLVGATVLCGYVLGTTLHALLALA